MEIEFACPFCRKPHSVGPELAGRRGRCKDCGTVMRIPGERPAAVAEEATPREKPAARLAAPVQASPRPTSSPPPVPRPRPKTAPVPEPEPIVVVDDPYGLADELPAPSLRQGLVDAGTAEPEAAPLPRAGFEPSAKAKRKRVDEGPWGLPIRHAAMKVMVVAIAVGKFAQAMLSSGKVEGLTYVGLVGCGLYILVAALSGLSLIGAAVSLSRGNRLAFSGESGRAQFGWLATIVLSFYGVYGVISGFQGGDRALLTSLDARLSITEKADVAVYDRLISELIGIHYRLVAILPTLPRPESSHGRVAWMALADIARDQTRILSEAAATPKPTRGQVRQLYGRHHGAILAALDRTARAVHDALARLAPPADSEFGRMLRTVEADTIKYQNSYKKFYPAGATDSTGWYFAVFGEAAAPGR